MPHNVAQAFHAWYPITCLQNRIRPHNIENSDLFHLHTLMQTSNLTKKTVHFYYCVWPLTTVNQFVCRRNKRTVDKEENGGESPFIYYYNCRRKIFLFMGRLGFIARLTALSEDMTSLNYIVSVYLNGDTKRKSDCF